MFADYYAAHNNRTLYKVLSRNVGFFSAVTYDELKENGLYPSEANYMVSNDSIHFVQGKTAEKRQSRLGGLGQRKALCV